MHRPIDLTALVEDSPIRVVVEALSPGYPLSMSSSWFSKLSTTYMVWYHHDWPFQYQSQGLINSTLRGTAVLWGDHGSFLPESHA
jgi:hypothetical protein